MARTVKREQQAPTRQQSPLDQALPSNIEAERSILGAILLDNKTINQAIDLLFRDDFYLDSHRRIYDKMLQLSKQGRAIDPITLQELLKQSGDLDLIGGPAFIGALIDGVPRFSNILEYCRIVKGKAIVRKLITTAHQIISQCFDGEDEPQALFDKASQAVLAVRADCDQLSEGKSYVTLAEALGEARAELRSTEKNQGTDRMPTGFAEIDAVLGGGFNKETILLAAGTSKGKSLLAQQFALRTARRHPERVGAVFTLEMSTRQMGHRTYQVDSGIESRYYKSARFVQDEVDSLNAIDERYEKAKMFLYHPAQLTPTKLYAECLALKQKQGRLDYVVVDYLDLMELDRRYSSDYERIKLLSKELAYIKRSLNCDLILPIQFKPDADLSKNELGYEAVMYASALTPDADICVLFHPGLYVDHFQEYKLNFIKNRNSIPFTSHLRFNRNVGRFESRPVAVPSNSHPDAQDD